MKSIFKNKMPLLISLILVVVMVFGSVCYASSDDNFSDDDFKDTGYSDGSLKSVDDVLEFAGAIDVNNSKIYQSAVQRWGAGNVDCYYVICTSPCGTQVKYSIYSRHYLFCKKGTNIGLYSVVGSGGYKRYFVKANDVMLEYRRYKTTDDSNWSDTIDSYDPYTVRNVTYGELNKDSIIVATNLPRFVSEDDLDNYLETGNPVEAVNYYNPDGNDGSSFGWDSFKGTLTGGYDEKAYNLIINRTYSASGMLAHPGDYFVSFIPLIKLVGKNKNGEVIMGGYKFSTTGNIPLNDFRDGYIETFNSLNGTLSVYGNFPSLKDVYNKEFGEVIRIVSSFIAGSSAYDIEVTSCRLYVTYYLYCKGSGFSIGRRSDDVRCLSFDLLNYDGSSQGGEEVDPAEGTEDGSGNGGGNGSGNGSGQGISININNQNTQNNGSSSSDPKLDVTDDDFSMANVWKNIKSLFGLIDDPTTPEPDDGVMQMVKAGMGFMPSEYWTMILGLLSSAGIVSMIRIFRGS